MVKDYSDSERGTCCSHIGYSFRLAARVLLYAPSNRQDCTYNCLCYTSHGALAGTRNSSLGGRKTTPPTISERSTTELHLASGNNGNKTFNDTANNDVTLTIARVNHRIVVNPFYASTFVGARCSSVVRMLAHCAMGRRINPSWWTHRAISRSSQCSTTGATKAGYVLSCL